MLGWLKPRKKKLKDMALKEVMDELHSKFPQLVIQEKYIPPSHTCTKWILLRGHIYGDEGYRCSIVVNSSQIRGWAVRHSERVGHSNQAINDAKNYFAAWIREANYNDQSVTILDSQMHQAIKEWAEDFIINGWADVWCPACKSFTLAFEQNKLKLESTKDRTQSWIDDWHCQCGHLLKHQDEEIRFILR